MSDSSALCEASTEIARVVEANRVRFLSPIQLANNLDSALFGILMVAAWTYFSTFKEDRTIIKTLVTLLVLLNVAQTATVIALNIRVFVVYAGDWDMFGVEYMISILVFETFATGLAQIFFLDRVYKLSKSPILLGVLSLFSLGGVGLGVSTAILSDIVRSGPTDSEGVDFGAFQTLINIVISWKAVTFSCDFFITSSIVFFLHRSRNGWRRTDTIISSLIHFTCEAQILPLMAAFFFLVSYVADPGGKVFFIGSFAEGKLASLSVLHLLNSRTSIRRDLDDFEPTDLPTQPSLSPTVEHATLSRSGGVPRSPELRTSNSSSNGVHDLERSLTMEKGWSEEERFENGTRESEGRLKPLV